MIERFDAQGSQAIRALFIREAKTLLT